MKNYLATTLVLVSGIAIGFYTVVSVFAIDIDLLGAPYSNTTVEFSKDRILKQGDNEVLLPAGTKLTYSYSAKSVPIYTLNIVGGIGEVPPKVTDNTKAYFYANTSQ